jgi:hypothetical protein
VIKKDIPPIFVEEGNTVKFIEQEEADEENQIEKPMIHHEEQPEEAAILEEAVIICSTDAEEENSINSSNQKENISLILVEEEKTINDQCKVSEVNQTEKPIIHPKYPLMKQEVPILNEEEWQELQQWLTK